MRIISSIMLVAIMFLASFTAVFAQTSSLPPITRVLAGSLPGGTAPAAIQCFKANDGLTCVLLQTITTGTAAAPVNATTVLEVGAGYVDNAIVTTVGTTGNIVLYDNASACSGRVLGVVPGSTADSTTFLGKSYTIRMPFAAGLVACSAASGPAATFSIR